MAADAGSVPSRAQTSHGANEPGRWGEHGCSAAGPTQFRRRHPKRGATEQQVAAETGSVPSRAKASQAADDPGHGKIIGGTAVECGFSTAGKTLRQSTDTTTCEGGPAA